MHAVVVSGKARAAAHTVLNADGKHAVTLLRDGFAVFHTTRIYCDALNIVSTHAAADNAGTRLRMLFSYNNLDLAAAAKNVNVQLHHRERHPVYRETNLTRV